MDNGIVDRIRVIDHDLVILKAISAGSTLEAIADHKVSAVAGAIGQPDNDGMICQDFIEDNSLCGRPACGSSDLIGEVERAVRILSPFTPRIAILAYTPNTPVVEISGG